MDTFLLAAIVAELNGRIPRGARVDKVHQPGAGTLVLRLWTGREELRLLLSAEAGRGRLHLTGAFFPNPPAPPRFCQLLRARLVRIEKVEKVPGDRIVRFSCRGREEEPYLLVAELLGTRPNLLLLEGGGRIVDALHREAGGREAAPGALYVPPSPPGRLSLREELPPVPAEARAPQDFAPWLLSRIAPMTPLVARDLAAAVSAGVSPEEALKELRGRLLAGKFRPIVAHLSGKTILTALPLPHLPLDTIRNFDSPSEAAERFYEESSGAGGGNRDLLGTVRRAMERLRARQGKLAAEEGHLGDAQEGRKLGELLLANLHRIPPGASSVTVDDWYADPPVPIVIPLDPRLSPQENAERCFRGYKKLRKGEEHVARRLRETKEEIAWLEGVEEALTEAVTAEEIEAIRRELEEGGVRPPHSAPGPRRRPPDPRDLLRRGRTPGGFEIVWGKNNRTNDLVSREITVADDLWFHAHRMPGCHLVLRTGGKSILEEDLLYAAAVAAGYSRGRHDAKVEVMVAEGRAVRKPRGARPGLVTVEKYRTVMVRPVRCD